MTPIKYRIFLKGNEIENIEDIRKNFQVYELIELMNSGRLRMWLKENGYEEYDEKLSIWSSTGKRLKKQKLYDVFEVPYDEATDYNITDELLDELAKDKRVYKYSLGNHIEYSNEGLKKDMEYLCYEERSIQNPLLVYLNSCFDTYDIPYDIQNVHYVGFCGDGNYLPRVGLVYTPEKYAENHITFENVIATLKFPEGMGKFYAKYKYDEWKIENPDGKMDEFMDFIRNEAKSDRDEFFYHI